MTQPLITIYRPVKKGDRWVARADVNARGELIELQATASDKLAQRARGWYNAAAQWVGKFVQYRGGFDPRIQAAPGSGVFAEMPQIGYELVHKAIPYDEDVSAAAHLIRGAFAGNPVALDQCQQIAVAAQLGEPEALEALDAMDLIEQAAARGPDYPVAGVLLAAGAGNKEAIKALAAMREVSAGAPTRLAWHVDDYMHEPADLCQDALCACADEISARIVDPSSSFGQVRYVRRSRDQRPLLYTFRLIQARYGG